MLPSHLMDSSLRKNERERHTRLGQAPPPPLPSLCVTGAMCQMGRFQVKVGVEIAYCIFRPRQLKDIRKPPLIVIHGGPSIPSNYLLPIVNGVTDRSIVFYDQWGCGKSSRPQNDKIPFSISTMVDHLQLLIRNCWKISTFHLFGHSFGGLVAFEYLQKEIKGCQSLILASTPTSPLLIQKECQRLDKALNNLNTSHSIEEEDEEATRRQHQYRFSDAFLQTHECRLPDLPLVLTDALAQAGPTNWRGVQAITGYEACDSLSGIPTLIMVGEYDFCTSLCTEGWNDIIQDPSPQHAKLTNCSHYGMLEDEGQYGRAITNFLHQFDNQNSS